MGWLNPIPGFEGNHKIDSVGLPCSTLPSALLLSMCMDTLHAQLELPVSFSFCPKAFHLSWCSTYWQCSPFHYHYLLRAKTTCIFSSTVDWTACAHCGCPVASLCCWHTTVDKACQRSRVGKGSSLKLFFQTAMQSVVLIQQGEQHRVVSERQGAGLSKQPSHQIPMWHSSHHHISQHFATSGRASPPQSTYVTYSPTGIQRGLSQGSFEFLPCWRNDNGQ